MFPCCVVVTYDFGKFVLKLAGQGQSQIIMIEGHYQIQMKVKVKSKEI